MKKTLLALAVLGAFAGAASAQSSVTVYGKLDQAVGKTVASKDKQVMDNAGSRIGFKGTEDLGNGMTALFVLESQITPDTGAATGGTTFWNRQSYVGLGSKFGTVLLGRLENGAWPVVNYADPFGGDTVANLRDTGGALRILPYDSTKTPNVLDVRRLDNAVRYDGKFGAFSLSGSIAEATGVDKPYAVSGSYSGGPLYVGIGYENQTGENDKLAVVAAGYDFGVAKLTGSYSDGTTNADVKVKGFIVGVVAPFGALDVKAGYAQSKIDLATGSETYKKMGVGLHYKLSKRTKIYADYARIAGDVGADGGIADKEKNGYDFGIQHNF